MTEVVLGSRGCHGGLTAQGGHRGTAGFSSLGNPEGDLATGLSGPVDLMVGIWIHFEGEAHKTR